MAYPARKVPNLQGLIRRLVRGRVQFPDTKNSNLVARITGVDRRRAKNKVARASRKANRR